MKKIGRRKGRGLCCATSGVVPALPEEGPSTSKAKVR